MKFPFYPQFDLMDCGPTCLRMIARHYGRLIQLQTLREKAQISRDGVSLLGIAEAAESIGFRTMGAQIPFDVLAHEVPLPCIVHWQQNHFVVVYEMKGVSRANETSWLRKIIGGRTVPKTAPHAVEEPALAYDYDTDADEPLSTGDSAPKDPTRTVFPRRGLVRVADPARGLVSYPVSEFCRNWLVDAPEEEPAGIVLLLEPTPAFYQQPDEKTENRGVRQLFSYLGQFRSLLLQVGLGLLVSSGIQFIYPFLTQSLVDIGVNTHNLSFIYVVLGALALLLLGRQAVEFIRSWILLHISTRLNLSILSDFLIKLMRLPASFFDTKRFGDILQRIDDHHRIEQFLTGQTLSVLFSFVDLLLLGLVLAYYNLSLFVVFSLGTALYLGWISLFMGERRLMDYRRFEIASRQHSGLLQLISGIQDIKLAGAEQPLRWDWERLQARMFHLHTRTLTLNQLQHAGAFALLRGMNLLLLFLSAKAVIDGEITLGAMLAIQFIIGQLNGPIEQVVQFIQELQDARISLERLNEIHTLADEEPADRPVLDYLPEARSLSLHNIRFYYPGLSDRPIFEGLSLHIPAHKTTAIVGMSGSGKTTLLKLLLKFYEPMEGDIRVGSSSLRTLSHRIWRRHCGVVMQDGFIFSDTIARNIAVGENQPDRRRLLEAIRMASLQDFIDSLPLGYNTRIGAEGNGISQGQRQRILIARAIYKNPQFLFFDEATNALDASNEAAVMDSLNDFFRGRTVVVVAHRLSTVRNADQIVVLDRGQIVEIGTHPELVARQGAYWELVRNQLELDA